MSLNLWDNGAAFSFSVRTIVCRWFAVRDARRYLVVQPNGVCFDAVCDDFGDLVRVEK